MRLGWNVFGALAIAILSACESGETPHADRSRKLDGYGGLTLGSTFEDAMLIASPRDFNPYSLKECLKDMPTKGCFLSPDDDLTTFRRVEGIPYGLQLEFNRLGALTDITLEFKRRRTYDGDMNPIPATITKPECSNIVERTVDWVSAEYGNLGSKRPYRSASEVSKTSKGNAYWQDSAPDEAGFFATGDAKMQDDRSVKLFARFLVINGEPDCAVSVSFEESPKIVRRVPDPEMQAESQQAVEKAAKPKAQATRRYPYVAPDGVDITSEEDERNWKHYGTTLLDGGE